MTTETKVEATFFERLGEGFNHVTEGVANFLTRLMGSSNERYVRKLGYIRVKDAEPPYKIAPGSLLARINAFEPAMKELSNADLKGMTQKFRARLANKESLEDILPEAFAAVREAGWRQKGMRHFDTQMLGGIVLHRGNIAEMVTGEGKTLVATLPAYLNALTGHSVHVITVNDYLARRDCEWMLPIYQALGMTAGYIQSNMEAPERRAAYDCDITYGTNSEFGFDLLRDNMKPARHGDNNFHPYYQQCQRQLNYAIIDEVDNILIDEARTPLIISGPAFMDVKNYEKADEIAVKLTELQKKEPGRYYEIKEKEHTCHPTDEGIRKAEELAGVESFYTAGNMEWPHLIDNALKAHHLYKRDRNYMIAPDAREHNQLGIIIIDEFTGRAMEGRQWSDGLHQAVEAKHRRDGVKIKQETQTLATVTLQNFFKLYKKLAGMTGTAMTEANEFWKIYKLEVIAIPTNRKLSRINYPDVIYRTDKEKWDAILDEVDRVHRYDTLHLKRGTDKKVSVPTYETYSGEFYIFGTIQNETDSEYTLAPPLSRETITVAKADVKRMEPKGRPMLIGTTDVAKSEKLSAMLKKRGIKHELLNAKPENVAREAEIVAQAGRMGAVTISTNMAGRGTDIILGGNAEYLAWAQLKQLKTEDGRPLYPTRLEIPEDVWKQTVDGIEEREKMKEEGRRVAGLGGLHIIGTERHESRRVDNQLRGRAGRQGDPGTSRFFLSLQDDLMRIFAGEWVANVLTRLGMEEGQAIESGMVTRRIEAAQKKVEEHHFDQRKNLLEYDEVMDTQRKRIYGARQAILNNRNCKLLVLEYIDEQIEKKVAELLSPTYGAATFAEFAAGRLFTEYEASDFARCDYQQAEQYAKEKAQRMLETVIQDGLDENLSEDEDPSEWKWSAMANLVNSRYGLKLNDRDLKKIGRENLSAKLYEECSASINEVDLDEGKPYLEGEWGRQSIKAWALQKFQITLTDAEVHDVSAEEVKKLLRQRVRAAYREREQKFPVDVAMNQFMAEKSSGGGQRYDRQGLLVWCGQRFPTLLTDVPEDEFRTEPRSKLRGYLVNASQKTLPTFDFDVIDAKIVEVMTGTRLSEAADGAELSEWIKAELKIEIPEADLTGVTLDQARQVVWNAFDRRYRPEMRSMERSLLLNQLDSAWKQHLLTMDHLRATIALRSYAQVDPKTEYKREGMAEFDRMWDNLKDRITDLVFRMEEEGDFQQSVWSIESTVHESAASLASQAAAVKTIEPAKTSTNGAEPEKKVETIRNIEKRVGRNDPCPCGSGKKYKNCHMRLGDGPVKK